MSAKAAGAPAGGVWRRRRHRVRRASPQPFRGGQEGAGRSSLESRSRPEADDRGGRATRQGRRTRQGGGDETASEEKRSVQAYPDAPQHRKKGRRPERSMRQHAKRSGAATPGQIEAPGHGGGGTRAASDRGGEARGHGRRGMAGRGHGGDDSGSGEGKDALRTYHHARARRRGRTLRKAATVIAPGGDRDTTSASCIPGTPTTNGCPRFSVRPVGCAAGREPGDTVGRHAQKKRPRW